MSDNMICKKDKPDVIEAWRAAIKYSDGHNTLYEDSKQGRFIKPLGYALAEFMDKTTDWLCLENDQDADQGFIKDFCEIAAVQDCSPSEALSLIFDLKAALTVAFKDGIAMFSNGDEGKRGQNITKLHAMGRKIDRLMLKAFDEFMLSRELVMQVRQAELIRLGGRATR